jgi:hypothetical protein
MRLYPALPTKRTRAVIGDLIVLLLLLLFAWLALKVHDAVDRLAVLGTGVEEAGTLASLSELIRPRAMPTNQIPPIVRNARRKLATETVVSLSSWRTSGHSSPTGTSSAMLEAQGSSLI